MATEIPKKEWSNVEYSTWFYERQTELKHALLKDYIPTWLQILGRYNDRLNYIDGFGGIGAYHIDDDLKKGEYSSKKFGSPIIAIEHIQRLKKEGRIKEANVVIIDSDQGNIENIEKIISSENLEFKPIFIHGDFDKEINELLDHLEGERKELAPTFFFVDPFGFKIKHSTIMRLLQVPKSEVLINFMFTRINEFLSAPKIEGTLNDLFGCDEWKSCVSKKGYSREREIIKCYRNQFKKKGYFVVPYKFEFPHQRRTYYYLFHITQHHKGCSVLKDIFSKLASVEGGVMEFQAKTRSSWNLFSSLPAHKRTDQCANFICFKENSAGCEDCIYEKFLGNRITYNNFIIKIIDEVPLKEAGIKDALRELEGAGKLEVCPGGSRKRKRRVQGGFRDDDVLNFKVK